MNKILRLLLLLVLPIAANGQRIHLTDSANSWSVYCAGGGTDYYSLLFDYHYSGDTLIAGNNYKKLAGSTRVLQHLAAYYPDAGSFYLREDTVNGIVWCRSRGWSDSSERVIYNRAWNVGDTIWTPQQSGSSQKLYISVIDSTQVNSNWYRVYKVRAKQPIAPGNQDYFDIVEGIGSTLGPGFAFTTLPGGEFGIELRCYFNAAAKPVLSPTLTNIYHIQSFSNSGPCNLSASAPDAARAAYLSPNPVSRSSKIILPYLIAEGCLSIYNATGEMVAVTNVEESTSVPLPAMPSVPGLYYYRLTDKRGGQSFSGSFLFAE